MGSCCSISPVSVVESTRRAVTPTEDAMVLGSDVNNEKSSLEAADTSLRERKARNAKRGEVSGDKGSASRLPEESAHLKKLKATSSFSFRVNRNLLREGPTQRHQRSGSNFSPAANSDSAGNNNNNISRDPAALNVSQSDNDEEQVSPLVSAASSHHRLRSLARTPSSIIHAVGISGEEARGGLHNSNNEQLTNAMQPGSMVMRMGMANSLRSDGGGGVNKALFSPSSPLNSPRNHAKGGPAPLSMGKEGAQEVSPSPPPPLSRSQWAPGNDVANKRVARRVGSNTIKQTITSEDAPEDEPEEKMSGGVAWGTDHNGHGSQSAAAVAGPQDLDTTYSHVLTPTPPSELRGSSTSLHRKIPDPTVMMPHRPMDVSEAVAFIAKTDANNSQECSGGGEESPPEMARGLKKGSAWMGSDQVENTDNRRLMKVGMSGGANDATAEAQTPSVREEAPKRRAVPQPLAPENWSPPTGKESSRNPLIKRQDDEVEVEIGKGGREYDNGTADAQSSAKKPQPPGSESEADQQTTRRKPQASSLFTVLDDDESAPSKSNPNNSNQGAGAAGLGSPWRTSASVGIGGGRGREASSVIFKEEGGLAAVSGGGARKKSSRNSHSFPSQQSPLPRASSSLSYSPDQGCVGHMTDTVLDLVLESSASGDIVTLMELVSSHGRAVLTSRKGWQKGSAPRPQSASRKSTTDSDPNNKFITGGSCSAAIIARAAISDVFAPSAYHETCKRMRMKKVIEKKYELHTSELTASGEGGRGVEGGGGNYDSDEDGRRHAVHTPPPTADADAVATLLPLAREHHRQPKRSLPRLSAEALRALANDDEKEDAHNTNVNTTTNVGNKPSEGTVSTAAIKNRAAATSAKSTVGKTEKERRKEDGYSRANGRDEDLEDQGDDEDLESIETGATEEESDGDTEATHAMRNPSIRSSLSATVAPVHATATTNSLPHKNVTYLPTEATHTLTGAGGSPRSERAAKTYFSSPPTLPLAHSSEQQQQQQGSLVADPFSPIFMPYSDTPLGPYHAAARGGHADIIKYLNETINSSTAAIDTTSSEEEEKEHEEQWGVGGREHHSEMEAEEGAEEGGGCENSQERRGRPPASNKAPNLRKLNSSNAPNIKNKKDRRSEAAPRILGINEVLHGRVPLHEAIIGGHHRCVYQMIQQLGASVTYPSAVMVRMSQLGDGRAAWRAYNLGEAGGAPAATLSIGADSCDPHGVLPTHVSVPAEEESEVKRDAHGAKAAAALFPLRCLQYIIICEACRGRTSTNSSSSLKQSTVRKGASVEHSHVPLPTAIGLIPISAATGAPRSESIPSYQTKGAAGTNSAHGAEATNRPNSRLTTPTPTLPIPLLPSSRKSTVETTFNNSINNVVNNSDRCTLQQQKGLSRSGIGGTGPGSDGLSSFVSGGGSETPFLSSGGVRTAAATATSGTFSASASPATRMLEGLHLGAMPVLKSSQGSVTNTVGGATHTNSHPHHHYHQMGVVQNSNSLGILDGGMLTALGSPLPILVVSSGGVHAGEGPIPLIDPRGEDSAAIISSATQQTEREKETKEEEDRAFIRLFGGNTTSSNSNAGDDNNTTTKSPPSLASPESVADPIVPAFCPLCCVEEQPLHLAASIGDFGMVLILLETVVTAVCSVLGTKPTVMTAGPAGASAGAAKVAMGSAAAVARITGERAQLVDAPLNRWKAFVASRRKQSTNVVGGGNNRPSSASRSASSLSFNKIGIGGGLSGRGSPSPLQRPFSAFGHGAMGTRPGSASISSVSNASLSYTCTTNSRASAAANPPYMEVTRDLGLDTPALAMLSAFVNMRRFADGYTPLHVAAMLGYADIVDVLASHNGDLLARAVPTVSAIYIGLEEDELSARIDNTYVITENKPASGAGSGGGTLRSPSYDEDFKFEDHFFPSDKYLFAVPLVYLPPPASLSLGFVPPTSNTEVHTSYRGVGVRVSDVAKHFRHSEIVNKIILSISRGAGNNVARRVALGLIDEKWQKRRSSVASTLQAERKGVNAAAAAVSLAEMALSLKSKRKIKLLASTIGEAGIELYGLEDGLKKSKKKRNSPYFFEKPIQGDQNSTPSGQLGTGSGDDESFVDVMLLARLLGAAYRLNESSAVVGGGAEKQVQSGSPLPPPDEKKKGRHWPFLSSSSSSKHRPPEDSSVGGASVDERDKVPTSLAELFERHRIVNNARLSVVSASVVSPQTAAVGATGASSSSTNGTVSVKPQEPNHYVSAIQERQYDNKNNPKDKDSGRSASMALRSLSMHSTGSADAETPASGLPPAHYVSLPPASLRRHHESSNGTANAEVAVEVPHAEAGVVPIRPPRSSIMVAPSFSPNASGPPGSLAPLRGLPALPPLAGGGKVCLTGLT